MCIVYVCIYVCIHALCEFPVKVKGQLSKVSSLATMLKLGIQLRPKVSLWQVPGLTCCLAAQICSFKDCIVFKISIKQLSSYIYSFLANV